MQLYLILYIKICYDSENDVRFVIHLLCVSKIYSSHAVMLHRLVLDSVEKKRVQIHISRKRERTENSKSTILNNLLYSRFKTATKIFVK